MFVADFVDEQVVYEGALRREQPAVLRLAYGKFAGVVGTDVLHELQGLRAAHFGFAHVAHVEKADGGAHGQVFVNRAAVLHGHIPAAKRHHLAACLPMHSVERSLFQGFIRQCVRPCVVVKKANQCKAF